MYCQSRQIKNEIMSITDKTQASKNEAYEIYKTSELFCFSNRGIAILEDQLNTLISNFDKGYYDADFPMKLTIQTAINQLENTIETIKMTHVRAKSLEAYALRN